MFRSANHLFRLSPKNRKIRNACRVKALATKSIRNHNVFGDILADTLAFEEEIKIWELADY